MSGDRREFNGMLLPVVDVDSLTTRFAALPGIDGVVPVADSHWYQAVLTSIHPLAREIPEMDPPPYTYRLLLRVSGSRLLIACESRDALRVVLRRAAGSGVGREANGFAVAALVEALAEARMPEFAASEVHARVPSEGVLLKSISAYGEDIARTEVFAVWSRALVAYSIGLRLLPREGQVLRVWTEGRLAFDYMVPRDLNRVDHALRLLSIGGFILPGRHDIEGGATTWP